MAVTVASIKQCLTEFASTPDADVQKWLDVAQRRTNEIAWGALADDATTFLTGHFLKLSKSGGSLGGGPLQSKRVGQLAASFKVSEWTAKSVLGSTTYGAQYLDYTRLVYPGRCI